MLYTFPPTDVDHCTNERMSEKVTGPKRRQRDGFSGLHSQSLYYLQNPLHNLDETDLSSVSSVGIIWVIKKTVAILVQM